MLYYKMSSNHIEAIKIKSRTHKSLYDSPRPVNKPYKASLTHCVLVGTQTSPLIKTWFMGACLRYKYIYFLF